MHIYLISSLVGFCLYREHGTLSGSVLLPRQVAVNRGGVVITPLQGSRVGKHGLKGTDLL